MRKWDTEDLDRLETTAMSGRLFYGDLPNISLVEPKSRLWWGT